MFGESGRIWRNSSKLWFVVDAEKQNFQTLPLFRAPYVCGANPGTGIYCSHRSIARRPKRVPAAHGDAPSLRIAIQSFSSAVSGLKCIGVIQVACRRAIRSTFITTIAHFDLSPELQ